MLAVDAAQGVGIACLHHDGVCLHAEHVADRPHSQTLLPQWEQLLEQAGINWQQLDGFAVGIGPGSFTGTRVVAATINGLNAVLEKPVFPLDSLAILSLQSGCSDPHWVIEDARVGEAFAGCYHAGNKMVSPMLISWGELSAQIKNLPVVCSQQRPDNINNPWIRPDPEKRSEALAQLSKNITLSAELPHVIQPQYLQPTQAERAILLNYPLSPWAG